MTRPVPILGTAAYSIAYINFEKEEDAARALNEMNGKPFQGHNLQISFYDKSQQMHVFVSESDVISSENMKGLYLKGIDRKVSTIKYTGNCKEDLNEDSLHANIITCCQRFLRMHSFAYLFCLFGYKLLAHYLIRSLNL